MTKSGKRLKPSKGAMETWPLSFLYFKEDETNEQAECGEDV